MMPLGSNPASSMRNDRSISPIASPPTLLESSVRVSTVSVMDRISRSKASVPPSGHASIRGTATSRIVPMYRAISARWNAGCMRRRCRRWYSPPDSTSPLPISCLVRPKSMPFSSFLAWLTSACLMTSGLFST